MYRSHDWRPLTHHRIAHFPSINQLTFPPIPYSRRSLVNPQTLARSGGRKRARECETHPEVPPRLSMPGRHSCQTPGRVNMQQRAPGPHVMSVRGASTGRVGERSTFQFDVNRGYAPFSLPQQPTLELLLFSRCPFITYGKELSGHFKRLPCTWYDWGRAHKQTFILSQ